MHIPKEQKRGFEMDFIGWMIIAILVMTIILIAYSLFSGRGAGLIDRIINYFRFGMFTINLI